MITIGGEVVATTISVTLNVEVRPENLSDAKDLKTGYMDKVTLLPWPQPHIT